MNPLPLPVRIAAGLVATAVEQARELPRLVVEFPVTAISQTLQTSMRMQQKVTELAIKGDRALGALRPGGGPGLGDVRRRRAAGRQRPGQRRGQHGHRAAPAGRSAHPTGQPDGRRRAAHTTAARRRGPSHRAQPRYPEPPVDTTPADDDASGPNVLPGYWR